MLVLDKENFENEVEKASSVVMVDFWSESCDRCKEIMPDVEKLEKAYEGKIKFCKLDIKGNRRLAMAQKVMGLPSFVFYQNGERKEHLSGEEVTLESIETTIKSYL